MRPIHQGGKRILGVELKGLRPDMSRTGQDRSEKSARRTHHKVDDGEDEDAVEAAPSGVSQPGAQDGCQVAGALKQHELH